MEIGVDGVCCGFADGGRQNLDDPEQHVTSGTLLAVRRFISTGTT
jgi:hypothetical protein